MVEVGEMSISQSCLSVSTAERGVRQCQLRLALRQIVVLVEQNQRSHRLEERSGRHQAVPTILHYHTYAHSDHVPTPPRVDLLRTCTYNLSPTTSCNKSTTNPQQVEHQNQIHRSVPFHQGRRLAVGSLSTCLQPTASAEA